MNKEVIQYSKQAKQAKLESLKLEGVIQHIDITDQNIVGVNTEVPKELDKISKEDKMDFEAYKAVYKDSIDEACTAEYGNCEDSKLWEDTAKDMYLKSNNYIPAGDEYKPKEDLDHLEKVEESKEVLAESLQDPFLVIEDNGGPSFVAGPFETRQEAVEYKNDLIEKIKIDPESYNYYEKGNDLRYTLSLIKVWKFSKVNEDNYYSDIVDYIENANEIDSWAEKMDLTKFKQAVKTESKELKTESRSNDIEDRVNQAKEWKQRVEDAVEADDLEQIVNEILESAEDIKDINFAGEDLVSGMEDVLDNGDALARGPVTYVKSVKRDMQNILDDFIDNYEQAFNEESLEESKLEERIKLTDKEIELLRDRLRKEVVKYQKFKNDEDLEKYLDQFMPMWIEMQENLGERVTESRDRVAENLSKFIYDLTNKEDFEKYGYTAWSANSPEIVSGMKVYEVYRNGESNYTKEDIKEAVLKEFPELKVHGYSASGNNIWFTTKEKKQEDQYDVERRKGRPNLTKIAQEIFDYDDYYVQIVDNYKSEWDFVVDNVAEVAAEYNLREQAAEAVMRKIYKMAKEAKSITDAETAE